MVEELELVVSDVYADPSLFTPNRILQLSPLLKYPEAKFYFQLNRITPVFGLSPEVAKSIQNASKETTEFGGLLVIFASVLASILIPLNVSQLIALFPIKLQPKV